MRLNDTCRVRFELVEQPIKVATVKDQAAALLNRLKARTPDGIEGPTANADIGHCFRVGETALHEPSPCAIGPKRYAPVGAIQLATDGLAPLASARLTVMCGFLRRLKKSFMEVP